MSPLVAKLYLFQLQRSFVTKPFILYGTTQSALKRYKETTNKTHVEINEFLKLCSRLQHPQELTSLLWNDLVEIAQNEDGKYLFYGLVLKHCVKDITQCTQTLHWMAYHKCYNPKDHKHYSAAICKIIKLCNDRDALHEIHSLVHGIGMHDIHIQMAFLNAFVQYSATPINDIMAVFHSTTPKDVIFIGAVMKALIHREYTQHALDIYHEYNWLTDDICHILAIKACMRLNDLKTGKQIHSKIQNHYDMQMQTTLIEFYGHFREIETCEKIFYSVKSHQLNVFLISAMMKMYINNHHSVKALALYHRHPLQTSTVTHGLAIKACIHSNDYQNGKTIHSDLMPLKDSRIAARFIEFYAHFGELDAAWAVFNAFSHNQVNSFMINSMMKAWIQHGQHEHALNLYERFETYSVLNEISDTLALKTCVALNDVKRGKRIINGINMKRVQSSNLWSALIQFHGHFGKYTESFHIFNRLTEDKKTTLVINSFMTVCLEHDYDGIVLDLYDKYEPSALHDQVSHLLAIKACIKQRDLHKGIEICNKIDLDKADLQLKSTLIEFLGEFNLSHIAKDIFHSVKDKQKDSVLIGCMMKAFTTNNEYQKAMEYYDQHQWLQNNYLHSLAIKACIKSGDYEKAKQIEQLCSSATPHILIQTARIDLYGNLGDIETAKHIFDNIDVKLQTIACYNAMMESYYACGLHQETIHMFDAVFNGKTPDLLPDIISYRIALKACAERSSLHFGQKIHQHLERSQKERWMLAQLPMQICLITFYGKCGMLRMAEDIFKCVELKDVSVWNSMINAFGRNGECNKAYQLYLEMKHARTIVPNDKTFIQLMNGFNHCGDMDRACTIWYDEIDDRQIKYNGHVVTALVDGLSKKGMLDRALQIITEYETNNSIHHESMWMALLSGCNRFSNKDMGNKVYDEMESRFNDNQKTSFNRNTRNGHKT
eukprot:513766_1